MKIGYLAFIALLIPTIEGLYGDSGKADDFAAAYSNDEFWPAHITPEETIYDESGNSLLQANIPVTLIRAYEDGKLSVVDRKGNMLIEHSKTDFCEQVQAFLKSKRKAATQILLHQLGRRTFDRSYDQSKAVSEQELSKYRGFLIVRTSSEKEFLGRVLKTLPSMREHLNKKEIRPIIVFDELMRNYEFSKMVERFDIAFPVVAPIFQKGFVQALFSEREQNSRVLLLSISGKLLGKYKKLEDYPATRHSD